jgi:hypothetical protein
MDEEFYVEYSVIQKCFHIDTMKNIQRINNSLCERRISNGYVIIGGPFNWDEAMKFEPKYTQKRLGI